MKQFHANRLVKLAEHLVTVPAELFDLDSFVEGESIDNQHLTKAKLKRDTTQTCTAKQLVDVNCGTTACALGWGATIPGFRRAGLSLEIEVKKYNTYNEDGVVDNYNSNAIYGDVIYKDPTGTKYEGFEAGSQFFGISIYDSYSLFDPWEYSENEKNIRGVLQRIADVLRENEYSDEAGQVSKLVKQLKRVSQ